MKREGERELELERKREMGQKSERMKRGIPASTVPAKM